MSSRAVTRASWFISTMLGVFACSSEPPLPRGLEHVEIDLTAATEVDPGALYRVVQGGTRWDGPKTTVLDGPIVMRFGAPQSKATRFDWSFDRDDVYQVVFLRGEHVVGERIIEVEDNHGVEEGLWRSDYSIPKTARPGFDRVYIAPISGDGEYAIGHFNLIENAKRFKKQRRNERRRRNK